MGEIMKILDKIDTIVLKTTCMLCNIDVEDYYEALTDIKQSLNK